MSWTVTGHAAHRMDQMGVEESELFYVLEHPSITYPSPPHHGPGRSIAVAGRLAIVHNPTTKTVITVLWHGASGRAVDGRAPGLAA